jgi:UDP-4-amino-4,6-dideoxy-N-acetyl-beta-L-altrosamine transaminase
MDDRIPYGHQTIDDDDVAAVVAALRSDFLTTGPRVREFEESLARRTGARYACAVSSGTAALHLAYAALGIGPGDEIVTTPLTFAATSNAALYLGARPVFVDVEPDTGTLDACLLSGAITERTRAIVAVDFGGLPADYDAIRAIADAHGLPVVADAAHSLGAIYHERDVGTLADVTTLSFHPVKHITTGEGGAVLCDDAAIHRSVSVLRTHGVVKDPSQQGRDEGPWYYEMQALGFNYRITDIQCALGTSQLVRLDAFLARRRWIASRYDEAFDGLAGLVLPGRRLGAESAWHLYILRVLDADRRRPFFEALHGAGLGVQVHYIPVYRHPYYVELGYRAGLCPAAEDFYARAVSIPIYPGMSDGDVARVIETVTRVAGALLA